jgi:GNAT superfamily N-acetyltransferase
MRLAEITPAAWPVFEELFGPAGIQGGCWCSYFRMHSREYAGTNSAARRAFVRDAVDRGEPFGLVAVDDDHPVGWISVSPRQCFRRLEQSTVARPEPGHDPSGTWSVVCFYISRAARGRGLATTMLHGATAYAARNGATAVEGYPIDTTDRRVPVADLYYGTLSTFLRAGFEFIERRGPRRVLVRKIVAT